MADNETRAAKDGRRGGRAWGGLVLVALLVVAVGLGVLMFGGTDAQGVPGFDAVERRALLPELRGRADEVAAVTIQGGAGSFMLQRGEDAWRLRELGGYPARAGAAEELLSRLTGLEAVYVSESRQPDYQALRVADPGAESGAGVGVTLHDGSGDEMGRVIVGDRLATPGGQVLTNTVVRQDDDPRAWLVDADFQVSGEMDAWADTRILNARRADVRRVAVTAPDGNTLAAQRQTAQDAFQITERGDRSQAEALAAVEMMASALEHLTFEGVRAVEEVPLEGDVWQAEIAVADGLVHRASLYETNGTFWATFAAEAEGDAEAASRAEAFNARHQGWAYRLPAYAGERFIGRAVAARQEQ